MMGKQPSLRDLKKRSLDDLRREVKKIEDRLSKDKRKIITYSKNFTLSLSNYCSNQCGYCFYNYKVPKVDGESNVIILGDDQMKDIIQKGMQNDCKEVLLISGERPDSFPEVKQELEQRNCPDFISFIKDICTYLLDFKLLPHVNIGLLNRAEMEELKPFTASMGLMLESTSLKLFKKGGVHEFSPGKRPKKRINHIENAGKLKIPFTTGLLIGIGETFEDRIKDLLLINRLHEEYGHIQEVILQNFIQKAGIAYTPEREVSIEEMLRLTGIARIIFGNRIGIQVPPNLIQGHEKRFLDMGITDFGGISPFTIDYINPEQSWPQIEHLSSICEEEGYILRERLPIYEKYIHQSDFCPETIKKVIDNINLS